MHRLVQLIARIPAATLLGSCIGVLVACVAAALALTPLRLTGHPLLPFALAPLPAAFGAWGDWARIWRPSRRTRWLSFAALTATTVIAIGAAIAASIDGSRALIVAPAIPIGIACLTLVTARVALFIAPRGGHVFGWELACGTIRREEIGAIVIETADGILDVSRDGTADLASRQTVAVSAGSPIAILGRFSGGALGDGPFRSEARRRATTVIGAAASPTELVRVLRRRAHAWTLYLLVLGLSASALATAAAHAPPTDCPAFVSVAAWDA